MKKTKKLNLVSSILGIILAAVLKAITDVYWDEIRKHTFVMLFLTLIVVFVIVRGTVILLYEKFYDKKIDETRRLLYRGNYSDFIREIKRLFENAKVKEVKTRLKLNLSLGYLYNKEYDLSLNVLSEIKESELSAYYFFKVFYVLNLFSVYYEKKDYQAAIRVYEKYEELIEENLEIKKYGNIAYETQIKYYFIKHDFKKAEETLKKALSDCKNKKWINRFKEYENLIKRNSDINYMDNQLLIATDESWNYDDVLYTEEVKNHQTEENSNIKISYLTYILLFLTFFFPVGTIILPSFGYRTDFIDDKVYLIILNLISVLILFFVNKEKEPICKNVVLTTCMLIAPFSVLDILIFLIRSDEILKYLYILVYEVFLLILATKYAKQIRQMKISKFLVLFMVLFFLVVLGIFLDWLNIGQNQYRNSYL